MGLTVLPWLTGVIPNECRRYLISGLNEKVLKKKQDFDT